MRARRDHFLAAACPPRTRGRPRHVQATDASLLPSGGTKIANHTFPRAPCPPSLRAPVWVNEALAGLALLSAKLPHVGRGYPAASSALLASFAKFGSVPARGDLETGAAQDQENIEKLVESAEILHRLNLRNTSMHVERRGQRDPLAGMAKPAAAGISPGHRRRHRDFIGRSHALGRRARNPLARVLVDDSRTFKPDTLSVLARVRSSPQGRPGARRVIAPERQGQPQAVP